MQATDEDVGPIAHELPPPGPVPDARWSQFIRRTRPQWERLGRKLLSQWVTSYALELADVVQAMLLHAVLAHRNYDPDRGVALGTHVVWNAMAGAKRAIHKDRQVQSRDRSRGRSLAPRPTSDFDRRAAQRSLDRDALETLVDRTACTKPTGQRAVDDVLHNMRLAHTEQERAVMAALLHGLDLADAGKAAKFGRRCEHRARVAAVACLSRAS